MQMSTVSSFQDAISRPRSRGLGAITILAWIASCDGNISPSQHKLLRQFAESQKDLRILELALQVAMNPCIEDLKAACRVIQEMPTGARQSVLRWAFAVATADNRVGISGNYALRFLADLTETEFSTACRTARKKFPLPGDVSSVDWWNRREGKTSASSDEKDGKQQGEIPDVPAGSMTVEHAKRVLRLGGNPTDAEITKAFRRMAMLYHPDRHAQKGHEALRSAAKSFARARKAFELLSGQ